MKVSKKMKFLTLVFVMVGVVCISFTIPFQTTNYELESMVMSSDSITNDEFSMQNLTPEDFSLSGLWLTDHVTVGSTASTIMSYVLAENQDDDMVVFSLDHNYDIQWSLTLNTLDSYDVKAITRAGNYLYVVGFTDDTVSGDYDVFYTKIDRTDGTHIWTKTWGSAEDDYAYDIAAGTYISDSGFYICGDTRGHNANSWDSFLLRIDINGNVQEELYWGNSGNAAEHAYALLVDDQTMFWDIYILGENGTYGSPSSYTSVLLKYQTTFPGSSTSFKSAKTLVNVGNAKEIYQTNFDTNDIIIAGDNIARIDLSGNVIWYSNWEASSPVYGCSIYCDGNRVIIGADSAISTNFVSYNYDTGAKLGELDDDVTSDYFGGTVAYSYCMTGATEWTILARDSSTGNIDVFKSYLCNPKSDDFSLQSDIPYEIYSVNVHEDGRPIDISINIDDGYDDISFSVIDEEYSIEETTSLENAISTSGSVDNTTKYIIVHADYSSNEIETCDGTLTVSDVGTTTLIYDVDSIYSGSPSTALLGTNMKGDQTIWCAKLTVTSATSDPIYFLSKSVSLKLPSFSLLSSDFTVLETNNGDNSQIDYIQHSLDAGVYYIKFTAEYGKEAILYSGNYVDMYNGNAMNLEYLDVTDIPEEILPTENGGIPGASLLWLAIPSVGIIFVISKRSKQEVIE